MDFYLFGNENTKSAAKVHIILMRFEKLWKVFFGLGEGLRCGFFQLYA